MKIESKTLVLSLLVGFLLLPTVVLGQSVTPAECASINTNPNAPGLTGAIGTQSADEITALICKPQPRIRIPGLSFTDTDDLDKLVEVDSESGKTYLNIPFLGEYIAAVYKYAVAAASILALLVIIVSAIQWMSPGNVVTSVLTKVGGEKQEEQTNAAKKRILGAVTGLILALTSYVILFTISPELVQFKSLRVEYITGIPIEDVLLDEEDPTGLGATRAFDRAGAVEIAALIGLNNEPACSVAAASAAGFALNNLNICVQACSCAWSATRFLEHIGCIDSASQGSSSAKRMAFKIGSLADQIFLPLTAPYNEKLESSEITTEQLFQNMPPGALWRGGHAGASLGNGQYFNSGGFNRVRTASDPPACPRYQYCFLPKPEVDSPEDFRVFTSQRRISDRWDRDCAGNDGNPWDRAECANSCNRLPQRPPDEPSRVPAGTDGLRGGCPAPQGWDVLNFNTDDTAKCRGISEDGGICEDTESFWKILITPASNASALIPLGYKENEEKVCCDGNGLDPTLLPKTLCTLMGNYDPTEEIREVNMSRCTSGS